MVMIDGSYAGAFRFRDAPRDDSRSFIGHLASRHHYTRVLLVSGDRDQEVRYLADHVGISEVYAEKSPEEKVMITRAEVARAPTLFMDNDPAAVKVFGRTGAQQLPPGRGLLVTTDGVIEGVLVGDLQR